MQSIGEGRIALKLVSVATRGGRERIVSEVVTGKLKRCVGALTLLLWSALVVLLMKYRSMSNMRSESRLSHVVRWHSDNLPFVCFLLVLF
jgi:hypothetical protein